ncbi:MAG: helix-turn-helix domain-containing protein [Bryobacteraceae bacterium]|nr:helix-turn-helix domain-containing protein [Bryobacteraceae bacterium]
MTLAQVAEFMKVSYQRAAELVRRRVFPGFHLGRQVRVRRGDLLDFMARGTRIS